MKRKKKKSETIPRQKERETHSEPDVWGGGEPGTRGLGKVGRGEVSWYNSGREKKKKQSSAASKRLRLLLPLQNAKEKKARKQKWKPKRRSGSIPAAKRKEPPPRNFLQEKVYYIGSGK